MNVAMLTSGGDCPGLNAVIRAVTKSLLSKDKNCKVLGISDGFVGLTHEKPKIYQLNWENVSGILHVGGTILGTSNSAAPLKDEKTISQVIKNIKDLALDVMVVIGGDGTMSLANEFSKKIGIECVGVPKTIDNDIVGCDRSFGFDTAVNTATESIRKIESTANSHHRVMIIETMGRHAGWLALESGIAGAADIVLLPEIDYDLEEVIKICKEREARQRYTIICIGEGAKEQGFEQTIRQRLDYSYDPIRLGGVAHVLCQRLQPHLISEVRATVLGHVQRGGEPTPFDRVLATRFGHKAADLVLNKKFGRTVTLKSGQIDSIEISKVANQQRKISLEHELIKVAKDIGICLGKSF